MDQNNYMENDLYPQPYASQMNQRQQPTIAWRKTPPLTLSAPPTPIQSEQKPAGFAHPDPPKRKPWNRFEQ